MSSQYTGNAANVSNSLQATITGVSAGPNSTVTTAVNHDFFTGDHVVISGVSGITGVNSYSSTPFTITVLTPTTFQINNGATTGAYSSGGTATDQSLTPASTLPSDGDSFDVASVNVAFETLFDRSQFLANEVAALQASLLAQSTQVFTFTGGQGVSATAILSIAVFGQFVECLTPSPHYLQTGMTVGITGATGATGLNGTYVVTVQSANLFEIAASVSGSYTGSSALVVPVIPANCNAVVVCGWGSGGGGEGGGGGHNNSNYGPNTYLLTSPQGGGGAGAPLTLAVIPAAPGTVYTISGGAAAAGGSAGTSSVLGGAGADGSAMVLSFNVFTTALTCPGGLGAGVGYVINSSELPSLNGVVIAPGGSGDGSQGDIRKWPTVTNSFIVNGGGTLTNVANFITRSRASGGAAVTFVGNVAQPNPSTAGVAQLGWAGGNAGAIGTGGISGSSPGYIPGAGGGGGGAGPGGPGGNGGAGSSANSGGNTSAGGAATSSFVGGTGAGGGGGGNAGVASGTTGNGGAGGASDTGQMTIYFLSLAA